MSLGRERFVVVLCLIAVTGGPVLARDVITQTIPIPGESIISNDSAPGTLYQSEQFTSSFQLFNGNLGTLTQASFAVNYDFQLSMTGGAGGGGGSGAVNGTMYVNGIGDQGLGGGNGTGGGVGPGQTLSFPFSVTVNYLTDQSNTSGTLASLTGATAGQMGAFLYDCSFPPGTMNPANYTSVSPGGVTSSLDLLNSSQLVLTYTYTPVPEPSALALLAIGGSAALLNRRKKVRPAA